MRKIVFLLLTLSISWRTGAQQITKYFDFNWKECPANEARFMGVIIHTDSGWLRKDYFIREKKLQMKGLYKDSDCKFATGQFIFFHANGNLQTIGKYTDNKKEGLWISFYENGNMRDSTVYEAGKPAGISIQWHSNGYMSDSTFYRPDGTAVKVGWFPDGTVSEAGYLTADMKLHGKWQFFHANGKLSAAETFNAGKLVDRQYYAEDGTLMSDTTDHTRPAEFPGGIPAWMKYLERNLFFPPGYEIINGDKAAVVVEFTVDKEGKATDVRIATPFHPAFDAIALRTFKNSPVWKPAINHNRKVSYSHRQAVYFSQTRE
jgi:TonB family protein